MSQNAPEGLVCTSLSSSSPTHYEAFLAEWTEWNTHIGDLEGLFLLPQTSVMLATPSGKIIGTVVAVHYADFSIMCYVAVAGTHRRRGLATWMMRRLLDELAAAGVKETNLMASTQGAPLYESLGYTRVAKRSFAYIRGKPSRESAALALRDVPPRDAEPDFANAVRVMCAAGGTATAESRAKILSQYHAQGRLLLVSVLNGEGVIFARHASDGHVYVGPMVARSSEAAEACLKHVCAWFAELDAPQGTAPTAFSLAVRHDDCADADVSLRAHEAAGFSGSEMKFLKYEHGGGPGMEVDKFVAGMKPEFLVSLGFDCP